jgi:formiminotetrahydrofolate cyclodeaminase
MQKKLILEDYVEELYSAAPTPGGGSAAALTAALAAALTAMVFNLTVGKKAFLELNEETQELVKNDLKKLDSLKQDFLDFMDKDSAAFLELISAYKLPKTNEEEIQYRSKKIQEGCDTALQVPLNLAVKASEIYEIIYHSALYGNKNVISDAGVAAYMLHCTIESAVLNVKINMSSIRDMDYRNHVKGICDKISADSISMKDKITTVVESKI